MSVNTENQITLSNGRVIGYAEYGDLHGKPVLHFHGMPSSRFECNSSLIDDIATRLHARIIVPERPGIGLSDYMPYTIASWPDIVNEFADALSLDRFAVMGMSSGGKYAAACAWKIPQRLTAAGIISGTCPHDLPGAKDSLSKQDRQLYWLADNAPWLLRVLLWKTARDARKDPSSVLALFSDLSEPDKVALSQAEVQQKIGKMALGAFHQGTRGVVLDWTLEARSWRIALQEVLMPVSLWHGEQDCIVPVNQGRAMANVLPNVHSTFYPGDGQISLMGNHYEELLSTILNE
jgi:pimeloyl-ACP methyl ester carboxylesterase